MNAETLSISGGQMRRVEGRLNWPAPHHMRLIDAAPVGVMEPAMVVFNDGEKLLGNVSSIDFEGGVLEFQPEAGPPRLLLFSSVQRLCLARTIELEPIPLALANGSLEAHGNSHRHKCLIAFKDASTVETDVASVLPRKAGLFLFVIDYADQILRWFIPTEAVASYRLDQPLGKALVQQHELASDALEAGLRQQQLLQSRKLGGNLAAQGLVTSVQLDQALARQKTLLHLKLGDVLVQEGVITPAQRDAALERQRQDQRRPLGEILVAMGVVTPAAIRRILVEQLGVPAVNLVRFEYDPNAIQAVSAELARQCSVMPLYRSASRIAVAMEDPLASQTLHQLEFFTGLKVDPVLASREDLLTAIEQFYGAATDTEEIEHLVLELSQENLPAAPSAEGVIADSDNTLVRLVNKMIIDAFDQGASDIHIESRAGDKSSRVRFRVDGVLAHYIDVPPNFRSALVSRLKIMSELDISEHRRPQDGRIVFEEFGPRKAELRVVMMPTAHGLEDVVMRILAAPRALSLDQLGLSPRLLAELKAMAQRSFGLLLVCGPTGSGKTTTLHSLLSHINTPERKIWTVEDPIEISQDGLCQVQVNEKLGLSFPEVLRSFLRADPDVIMVGETRDPETARTVTAASLTGHLVLSTMHTNSAVESIVRLLDFGLDPFNFSDALIGVLGQRLVRRLCSSCRTTHLATDEEVNALAHEYCRDLRLAPSDIVARWRSLYGNSERAITLHSAAGCPQCEHTGYKGRLGVYELLVAPATIKSLIQTRASSAEILSHAVSQGMVTFEQDAIEKILQGHLDLKQVLASCR